MDISSVLFSFLEAALKRRSTASVAEIKQVMSAKLKHTWRWSNNDWETYVQL